MCLISSKALHFLLEIKEGQTRKICLYFIQKLVWFSNHRKFVLVSVNFLLNDLKATYVLNFYCQKQQKILGRTKYLFLPLDSFLETHVKITATQNLLIVKTVQFLLNAWTFASQSDQNITMRKYVFLSFKELFWHYKYITFLLSKTV